MKSKFAATARKSIGSSAIFAMPLSLALLCGCAESAPPAKQAGAAQENATSTGDDTAPAKGDEKPFTGVTESSTDTVARTPATVAEARKNLDLTTIALHPKIDYKPARSVAQLTYTVPASVKEAFDFHYKQLKDAGWKDATPPYTSAESSNVTVAKNGYVASLSVFQQEPNKVSVMMFQHGNLALGALPKPPGVKPFYTVASQCSYITDANKEETAEVVRKLLLAEGWEPYGAHGDSQVFKKNAIELSARVLSAPAQGGKTVVEYSEQLLSADIPAPPDATGTHYADTNMQLTFNVKGTMDDLCAYYQKRLAADGWKATTEKPVRDGATGFMIFRNPQGDMLSMDFRDLKEDGTGSMIHFYTKADVDEQDRLAKEAAQKAKVKRDEEERIAEDKRMKEEAEANKPAPDLVLTPPVGSKNLKLEDSSMTFEVAAGKATDIVKDFQKKLEADDYKTVTETYTKNAGAVSLMKDDTTVNLVYTDTGFIPSEIRVMTTGVTLKSK